jgi:hypothetical protein
MPATSEKQKKFMDAAAHSSSFAKAAGIPQNVAKEFSEKSKGLKFGKGSGSRADLQKVNKPDTRQGKNELFNKGGTTMASKMNPGFMAMMAKKKNGNKMAEGGKADLKQDKAMVKKAVGMHDKQQHMGKKTDLAMLKKGGGVKKMASGGMTSMGSVRTAAPSKDGVAAKGKTKGSQIVMAGNKGMKSGGMSKKYC